MEGSEANKKVEKSQGMDTIRGGGTAPIREGEL